MENVYVKPGNQERGWNDPPQFSYSLQVTHGPQRKLLNKRPSPATASGVLPTPPNSSNTAAPPMCGVAPPPLTQARPPADGVATPPPHAGPMKGQRGASSSQSEPELETVTLVLNKALDACRRAVKDQVCNDVAKRLRLLEESWRTDKLSLPVRRRMVLLASDVQAGRWDSADDLHRSLMVDHVTEVSQWMVGVKRLIAETRQLSPELLEPLHSVVPPVQDPDHQS
ncbi:steroid receptor RNA activator 1 [Nothobranchius furzeri]|uniref:Steroid receptor RNA activator 1 n=1 Tax=Nothobranchius furzeri TaxID=105023 RepID=A0A1A7ZUC5_NOTFU|nr:steroid receptor RNA activator 1 [Nothobranchius furzeri]KAF7206774.1 transcript variant X2 [Nothobranchius furzeri]